MRYLKIFISIFILHLMGITTLQAIVDIELTKGVDRPLPIAIVPFLGQTGGDVNNNIASIVMNDLNRSGRFQVTPIAQLPAMPHTVEAIALPVWKSLGVESVVIGKVELISPESVRVNFALVDVYGNKQALVADTYNLPSKQLRKVGHHIADIIYERLTGIPGFFSTRIAYVLVKSSGHEKEYQLMVADADGENPRPLLTSHEPIMSPAWSFDGKKLAYVSFENKRSQIFISELNTGSRRKVSQYPGINSAPAWSPQGNQLAMVLSKDGAPKIYISNLHGGSLQQVTFGSAIDTEPTWSPDGQSIFFTSDRGGSPQIYKLSLRNGEVSRVTYSGNYNARASLSPDGKYMAIIHGDEGVYRIGVQELSSGILQPITQIGREDSPSMAPNGNMVLYGTEYGELGMASIDGKIKMRIPTSEGTIESPAWGA